MFDLTKFNFYFKMNIMGEMWTMRNLHGNHNVNIMIKFGQYNMTKIMMCHHVRLL
jgi:hypothetical protein